jgi:hypothetical protein
MTELVLLLWSVVVVLFLLWLGMRVRRSHATVSTEWLRDLDYDRRGWQDAPYWHLKGRSGNE